MALEKKIIGIPLAKGINDKVHDRVLPAGEMTLITNAHFQKGGELRKRLGFHSLSNDVPDLATGSADTTISAGKALAAYGEEILAFDGRYGYTKTSDGDKWVNKGTVVGCALEREPIAADSNLVQTATQIAQSGDFEFHVWSEVDPNETVTRTVSFTSVTPKTPKVIGVKNRTVGSGLDDLGITGTFTGTGRRLYEVVIEDDSTSPELFKWRYQDDGGAWSAFSAGHNCGFPRTLNLGVTVEFDATTGHTTNDAWQFYGGYGAVEINGATDHGFSPGGKVTMAFVHADWPDTDMRCTAVDSTTEYTLDFAQIPAPDAATAGTGTLVNGHSWRTYCKVLDKTTRAEIVGKKLINLFVTNNSVHNVPRAQVLSIGRFVYIFVHVGSGRVKHIMLDTDAGISPALIPGAALVDGSSDVTFSVDQTYPHWHVAPTNYINNASADGFVLLRRHTDSTQNLRLSTWKAHPTTGALTGTGYGEQASNPSPVSITDDIYFHDPNLLTSAYSYTTEEYSAAPEQMELAGGLMMSVVRPHNSANDNYIAIAYTKSVDATGYTAAGTADEPGGVYLHVYNSQLTRLGASNLATVDGVTTAFQDASPRTFENCGYVLLNGCAGMGARSVTDGKMRFFLTMIKNTTALRSRSQRHLIASYDVETGGGTGIADNNIDLHWCTVTSDCFLYNSDIYFSVGYASRYNTLLGDYNIDAFNNSVEMVVNQHGEVVAKGANGSGPWSQDINFRFLTDEFGSVKNRLNFMQTVPRVIGETTTKFRWGSARYHGVNITNDGSEMTAMDAALSTIDMNPTRYLPNVQANGALLLAGGILWSYSGDYFKEQNFFWWPEIHSFATASGDVDAGEHAWVAIYEWVDSHGKIQYSNPSAPLVYTVPGGGKKVTFQVYTLQLTYKKDLSASILPGGVAANYWGGRSEAKIVLYRSVSGDTGDGTNYRRCAEAIIDNTLPWQEVVDDLSDDDLLDNDVLYTTGGIAGHISPPSQYDIALFKDRVFLATTENTVWYSKRFSEGDEDTGFSDSFFRPAANRSERIRALCPNLEHMLIFGERNGYYMSGDGPNSANAGASFSPLRVFAPGQGAIDGTCRVETPVGVFFQTRQGLMLCGRDMKVTHKGAKVAQVRDGGGYVSVSNYLIDGHVFEDEHEVRFTSYDSGGILVYNYLFDQFSSWDLHADLDKNAASLIVGGSHYRLAENGILCKQHATLTHDKLGVTAKGYTYGFITGWINIGKLQQLGRIYRLLFLGEYNATSKPIVLVYTDYNETPTAIEMNAAPGTSKFQIIAKLPKQKVKAIKFGLTETTESTGGDFKVQGVSMLVGIKEPGSSFKFPTADHIE